MSTSAPARAVGLARGTGLNLVGAACSKTVTLLITLLLSGLLGSQAIGRYAQAFALLTVLDLLALLPFASALMRLIPVQRDDDASVRGTIRAALGLTGATAAVLAACLFPLAPWLSFHVLRDPGLLIPLRLVAVALVPLALADAIVHATMGFSRMRSYALVKLIAEPVVRLGLLVVLVLAGLGATGAVAALVVSCSAEAVLAWVALRRLAGAWYTGRACYRLRELVVFSVPTGLGNLGVLGLVWADSLILGVYRSSGDVGIYQVATRVIMLATFVIPAVNSAFAPRIAMLTHRGEDAALHRAYVMVTTWTLRLSVPGLVVLAVFPHEILRVFGPVFVTASGVTLVLLLGAVCNAWTGPGLQMLTMSGHPMWGAVNNACGLALNIGLNLVLVPRFGVMGAAAAWAAAMVANNLARLVQVHHLMGMWPFSVHQWTVVLAGVLAGGAAALATHWIGWWPARLLVGALVVAAGYAALSATTLDAKSRDMLRQLPARGR